MSKQGRPEDGTDNEGVNMAETIVRWRTRHRYYYEELARLYRLHVSPGARVLHVGCNERATHRCRHGAAAAGQRRDPKQAGADDENGRDERDTPEQ